MMHLQVILRNILCKRKKKIQKERQQRELRQEMHTQRQYGENTTEAKTSSNTMLSFLSSSLQPTSVVAIKAFNQIIRRKHQKRLQRLHALLTLHYNTYYQTDLHRESELTNTEVKIHQEKPQYTLFLSLPARICAYKLRM